MIRMSLVRAEFDEGPVAPTIREGRGLNELTVLLSSGLFGGNMLGGTFLIQVEIGSQTALFFLEGGWSLLPTI